MLKNEENEEIEISDNEINKSNNAENLDNVNFEAKINESINVVSQNKLNNEIKRGRGRPRKYPKTDDKTTQSVQLTPIPDISQFLSAPLIGLSKIPAAKYDCAEICLSEDEAKAIAESLNGVLNAFFPSIESIDPKMMSLFVLGTTIGSISLSKVMLYQEKNKSKQPEVKPDTSQNIETPINKPENFKNQVSAQDYFQINRNF